MNEFIDALRKAVEATAWRVIAEADEGSEMRAADARAEDAAWKAVVEALTRAQK
jgi:hypothetical protein